MNEQERIRLFRELAQLSLENAEQWAKDARMILNAYSFKHATVLMQFAIEETSKSIVCWHVSERIFPVDDNRIVEALFKSHPIKYHIFLAFMLNLAQGRPLKEGFKLEDYARDVKFIEKGMPPKRFGEKGSLFQNLALYSHKLRQICTYVDVDLKKGKVLTLEYACKPAAENIMNREIAAERLQGLEDAISYVRGIVEGGISDRNKNTLREFYESMPKEAWKTGEIPVEWIERANGELEGQKND